MVASQPRQEPWISKYAIVVALGIHEQKKSLLK